MIACYFTSQLKSEANTALSSGLPVQSLLSSVLSNTNLATSLLPSVRSSVQSFVSSAVSNVNSVSSSGPNYCIQDRKVWRDSALQLSIVTRCCSVVARKIAEVSHLEWSAM